MTPKATRTGTTTAAILGRGARQIVSITNDHQISRGNAMLVNLTKLPIQLNYDNTTIATTRIPIGDFVRTSGVKSGNLVIAHNGVDVASANHIYVEVYAAMEVLPGNYAVNQSSPLVSFGYSGVGRVDEWGLDLAAISSLPSPGLMVGFKIVTAGGTATCNGMFKVSLELIPT